MIDDLSALRSPAAIFPTDAPAAAASHRRMAWTFFGFSLILRLFFLFISDNQDGDAFARILMARKLVDQKQWNPTEVWLPVHFWIISIPYALGFASQIWPRLLTVVAGAVAVPFGYLIAQELFGSVAGFVTGIVLAMNPLHIHFSVVTVSEAFLILFITIGIWGFLRYTHAGSARYFAPGVLALNLGCGVRLEAWLVLPFLAAAVAFDRFLLGVRLAPDARRRAWGFLVPSVAFAAGWSFFSWVTYGDPLYIATLNAARAAVDPVYQASSGWYRLMFWPAVLLASLGPLTCVGGLSAAGRTGLGGPHRLLGVMFFGFLGIYYLQNLRSGMITDARYGLLLVWLLGLNLGSLFARGSRWARPSFWVVSSAVWMLLAWGIAEAPWGALSGKMLSVSPRPRVDAEIRTVGEWMRPRVGSASIVLGPGLPKYGPWMSCLDDWYASSRVRVMKPAESIQPYLDENDAGYLIVVKDSTLDRELAKGASGADKGLSRAMATSEFVVYQWPPGTGIGNPVDPLSGSGRVGISPGPHP